MTFSLAINLVTIFLCVAVLVQSVRMMRSIARMQSQDLRQLVNALDTAAANAGTVLGELKAALKGDATQAAERLRESKSIQEELGMLVGISNAMAERLLETADEARKICNAPTPPPAASSGTSSTRSPARTAAKAAPKKAVAKKAPAKKSPAKKAPAKNSSDPAKPAASATARTDKTATDTKKTPGPAATGPAAKSTGARKAPARPATTTKAKPAARMALA